MPEPEPEPNFTLGYLDFPTAWWLAARVEHPDPRCSYAQTAGALLCDCGAIQDEFERHRTGQPFQPPQVTCIHHDGPHPLGDTCRSVASLEVPDASA